MDSATLYAPNARGGWDGTSFGMRVPYADRAIRRLALTFSDAPAAELVAIVGSSGYVEIAANQSSAAKILGCGSRTPVELEFYVSAKVRR